MSGPRARSGRAVATGALAVALLAAVLLGGCATSGRQCSGALEPINGPARSTAPVEHDEP